MIEKIVLRSAQLFCSDEAEQGPEKAIKENNMYMRTARLTRLFLTPSPSVLH